MGVLFSEGFYSGIKAAFDRQMTLLEKTGNPFLRDKKAEILETLARCSEEEKQALTFLYSAMPMSDLTDYPASLFLTYARHGVYLRQEGPFGQRVPEHIFANYVLHYRVNNEDIGDTRGFFHDRIMGAIGKDIRALAEEKPRGGSGAAAESGEPGPMYRAAGEVNYWCAREATYRSTDGRTQNPRTMFGTATGRCGEESTLGVTALRSIGIPARQIYAPLWTHCDDNHAWVEAWCDGEWHFLGACEPEERLDRGWFIGPASRAMLLHSRRFGKDEPEERQVGPRGMAKVLNHLDRYARTAELTVKAVDESGRPVPGAEIDFQVMNHGELGSIAVVKAGEGPEDCGIVRFMTGYGSLYISAWAAGNGEGTEKKGLYGETIVSLYGLPEGEAGECTVTLKEGPECTEGWRELDFHAPEPGHMHDRPLTPEQESRGAERMAQATEYRQAKAAGFYDKREADRVLGRFGGEDRQALEKILRSAHSNMGEIVRFLEWDAAGWMPLHWDGGRTEAWKLAFLKSLREKDYWDTKAEVLTDCCVNGLSRAGSVPDEIFFRYLLCPRVSNEMLRPCRVFLERYLREEEKERIIEDPKSLPKMARQWIREMPEQEYEGLITSSAGCIRSGIGSRHSREVFCVNVYRCLGIPARLSFLDGKIQYYDKEKGEFVSAEENEYRIVGVNDTVSDGTAGCAESCRLILKEEGSLKLTDWEHYSVERFEGKGFRRLWLWKVREEKEGMLELELEPGIYRIVTVNRCKNGDQLARMTVFALRSGEEKEFSVSLREIPVEDMLTRIPVEDFVLRTPEGGSGNLSAFAGEGKSLFLWLAVTREPTEHILNELYERKEDFSGLKTPVYVVLRTAEDLENRTLRRTMKALPMIRTLLDDFGENYESLAAAVGQETGRLPLALVLEKGKECIYSDAGYNVGMADMLWRILQES